MALLSPQLPTFAGVAVTYAAAAAGGDTFVPSARRRLHVKNGGASPITVTITTPATYAGLAIADAGGSVAAGAEVAFGPFDPALFADSGGVAAVTYTAVTSVTVAVLEV